MQQADIWLGFWRFAGLKISRSASACLSLIAAIFLLAIALETLLGVSGNRKRFFILFPSPNQMFLSLCKWKRHDSVAYTQFAFCEAHSMGRGSDKWQSILPAKGARSPGHEWNMIESGPSREIGKKWAIFRLSRASKLECPGRKTQKKVEGKSALIDVAVLGLSCSSQMDLCCSAAHRSISVLQTKARREKTHFKRHDFRSFVINCL